MKENSELRAQARANLNGSWLPTVGVYVVFTLLVGVGSPAILIIGGPLTLGITGFFIHKARGEDAVIENIFDGFKNFGNSLLLLLLESIFVTLWSLLLVIPGIIKTLSYSMAFYILHDNPGMSSLDAITASRKMMDGYKWKLFCLYLSFIGWAFLCLFTFGIGSFWLAPYIQQSVANFYEDIKGVPEFEVIAETPVSE